MKANNILKAFLLTTITIISSLSLAQKKETKVWVTFLNSKEIPQANGKGKFISSNADMNNLIIKHNITNVDFPLSNSKNADLKKVVELTCKCDQQAFIKTLKSSGNLVKKIELAPEYQTLDTPNDYNVVFPTDYALDLINANAAWDITKGDSSIKIGITDQNFFVNHEELVGKVRNYDATNMAVRTHGTAVAIIAAGNTNNGIGKSSIGYNSSLGLYRMNFNDVLAASNAGCKVVNLSWASSCSFNPYAQAAINEVYNNGTFIVASAGNGTTCNGAANLVYPAAYNNVFSVSSVGSQNNHERVIGNPATTHQHNAAVDLCAPGYDVALSTAPGSYSYNSGTSFAAPYVTGTVSLMLAANPCLKNNEIELILKQTAFNLDAINPNYVGLLGAGRLNAAAAVALAKNYKKLQINATQVAGCTSNSGVISLNISGGKAPYSILWDNGSTATSLQNLTSGTYNVTVKDSNNCRTESLSIVLTNNETTIEGFVLDESAINTNDGSIDISVSGNVASYAWSNGATTQDIENLTNGTYTVNVTTANGCEIVKSFFVATYSNGSMASGSATGNNHNAGSTSSTSSNLNPRMANATTIATLTQDNNQGVSDLIVYPNPAKENVNVKWNGNASSLIVLNANGQVINTYDLNEVTELSLNNLKTGVYFIKINDNNNSLNQKLIVE